MKPFGPILASPVLCLALLGGMALQQRGRLRPDDPAVVGYHERALAAISGMDEIVTIDGTEWAGKERKAETDAVRLLKPNKIRNLRYFESALGRHSRTADLLVVQCRDSRDMVGHYPPICYKNIGYELKSRFAEGELRVGNENVPYTEYHFERWTQGQAVRLCIYNFFVVPGRGAVRDIKGVNEAAEDYERRFFGAAQFQVLVPLDQTPDAEDRRQIFAGLIRSSPGLIETLKNDGLSQ